MQTKSTFFSDRTNEEKEAYYKAKWYPLKEGEEQYIATNNNGGTFTINKITIDDRDFVLLDIGRMMIKENKRNTKVKIYELKEVIANALNFLQLSNDNKVLKQFFEEVFDTCFQ